MHCSFVDTLWYVMRSRMYPPQSITRRLQTVTMLPTLSQCSTLALHTMTRTYLPQTHLSAPIYPPPEATRPVRFDEDFTPLRQDVVGQMLMS